MNGDLENHLKARLFRLAQRISSYFCERPVKAPPIWVTNRAQRCETHKLALFLVGGRVEVSRAVSVVAILIKSNTARDFERVLLFDGLSRLFRWEVEGSDELKEGLVQRLRRATIWSQFLRRYRPVFVKPVTPAQEAKTVVASGRQS